MKIMYQEKYRKGAMKVNQDSLPKLRHISRDFYCSDAEVMEAGVVELKGGETREYQVIKVFLKEHQIGVEDETNPNPT